MLYKSLNIRSSKLAKKLCNAIATDSTICNSAHRTCSGRLQRGRLPVVDGCKTRVICRRLGVAARHNGYLTRCTACWGSGPLVDLDRALPDAPICAMSQLYSQFLPQSNSLQPTVSRGQPVPRLPGNISLSCSSLPSAQEMEFPVKPGRFNAGYATKDLK